jgi:hypothetical protein
VESRHSLEPPQYSSHPDQATSGGKMTDEFTIESKTVQVVRVRHVPHGHRYIFTIREREGRRLLEAGPFVGNTKASVPA